MAPNTRRPSVGFVLFLVLAASLWLLALRGLVH